LPAVEPSNYPTDMRRESRRHCLAALLASAALLAAPRAVLADSEGHPHVVLDRLDIPVELGASKYKQHLERALNREARKADWGASKDSTIEYRFAIIGLSLTGSSDVVTVTCSAVGRLPGGRSANSRLSFSGAPKERDALVKRVLTIVARGVIARLAEIERVRRGKMSDQRVRTPTGSE
jgi:hypothetical protein